MYMKRTVCYPWCGMASDKKPTGRSSSDEFVAEVRKHQQAQEKTYRGRALGMYPHVCGKCGREFSGKKLKELTVHHKDHNHDNNPPDGSNWELLCLYCHENEHARYKVADALVHGSEFDGNFPKPTLTHNPFGALSDLIKPKK